MTPGGQMKDTPIPKAHRKASERFKKLFKPVPMSTAELHEAILDYSPYVDRPSKDKPPKTKERK